MARPRDELEQRLIENPFDLEARQEYAEVLTGEASWKQALAQWDLLARQQPEDARPLLAAARCLWQLGDEANANQRLEEARRRPNYAALPADEPPRRPALQVIGGGGQPRPAEAEVVPLHTAAVRFSDVVGMEELKKTIRVRIVEPFLKPGLFARFGKRAGGGILLYGPPGCGKTMIAKAIATECQATFVPVGISDVLSMWVGGSEGNLAALFDRARQQSPAVLFFDELDALAFSRSKAHSDYTRTLVNEFLNQLDGVSGNNERVLILAATNMPWDVDNAMKRTGRFDRQIFVPPPDEPARAEMFRIKLTPVPTHPAVDFAALARQTALYTGADIDGVIDTAKERVLGDILAGAPERPLAQADLLAGIASTQPSALEWLRTARNLVKYAGDGTYKDVEAFLKGAKMM
jgi:transitional endoplasmic reticulum ATPase